MSTQPKLINMPIHRPSESLFEIESTAHELTLELPALLSDAFVLIFGSVLQAFIVFIPVAFIALFVIYLPLHWPIGLGFLGYRLYQNRIEISGGLRSTRIKVDAGQLKIEQKLFNWLPIKYENASHDELAQFEINVLDGLRLEYNSGKVKTFFFDCNGPEALWLNAKIESFLAALPLALAEA